MGKGDYLKYNTEDIKNKLKENSLKWINGEYKNRNSKITVETKEGYKTIALIGTLMNGAYPKIFFSKNPFTIYNINIWVKNNTNYKLLSNNYINSCSKLSLSCKEHGEFKISWSKLFQGQGCPVCANNKLYSLKEIKEMINNKNKNIEVISDEYKGMFEKITCKCKLDGFIWKVTPHNILCNNNGCPECKRVKFIGENNHRYNPNLTKEERELKRYYLGEDNYKNWRMNVFKRDNYTCRCCGKDKHNNVSHHLDGYNWCIEKRLDVDNGVTLCESCHKEFHSIYGYGNNTKEQFEEWIENKFRDTL